MSSISISSPSFQTSQLPQPLNMDANVLIASATLLDPRFKKVGFSDQRAADHVARNITADIKIQESKSNNSNRFY